MAHGCACPECLGLAEFMMSVTGRDYGLAPAPGHVVAAPDPDPCDGSMVCGCKRCDRERRDRVARIHTRQPVRQPWDVVRRAA